MSAANYRKELTAQIIAQLEAGTAPWIKPWDPKLLPMESPHNAVTGRPYQGGNHLWLTCQNQVDSRWCTYRQAQEQGWQVRKNERATTVEYWQWSEKKKDENGKLIEVKLDQPRVFFAHIFNGSQLDGIPPQPIRELSWEPEEAAERIIKASGADIRYDKTDTAFYSPTHDVIHAPPRVLFPDSKAFYGLILHEISHHSGHPSRLNRDLSHRFGTPGYAKEELRAELSSFFLASKLGIPHDVSQHASYIGSWIDVLRKDHNEIFRAAKDAEQITEYVLGLAREKTHEQAHVAESGASPSTTLQQSPPNHRATPLQHKQEMELEC